MNSRVLEIVFYLIDVMRANEGALGDMSTLSADLREMGYAEEEISRAYRLLSRGMERDADTLFAALPEHTPSVRVFSPEERRALTTEAQGFLLKLVQTGLVDPAQLELILDQVVVSTYPVVDVERMKQLVAGVLLGDFEEADALFEDIEMGLSSRLH